MYCIITTCHRGVYATCSVERYCTIFYERYFSHLSVVRLVIHFSERKLTFTFAICHRPSVCLSSVTFVHPTQAIEIVGNVSRFGTLATR